MDDGSNSSKERLVRDERMDVYDGCYKYVRSSLSIIGLWPYDDPKLRILRKNFFGLVLVADIWLQVSGFLLLPFNVTLFYKFLMRISPCLYCSIFYSSFICNETKIKRMFDRIRVEFRMKNTNERTIVKSYANVARQYSNMLYYSYVTLFIIVACVQIVFLLKGTTTPMGGTRVRRYPVSMGYYDNFQSHYLVFLLSLYVIVLVEAAVSIGMWSVYVHFTHHVCAMFRITGHMLDHTLGEKRRRFVEDRYEIHKELVRVIKYHNGCIRFLNELNVVYESCFLLSIFFATIIFTMDVLYLVDLQNMMKDYNELVMNLLLIISHTFLLFSVCQLGQNILDHGLDLHKRTYTCPWYVTPIRIQKMCLLMMAKSAEPLYLSVGKMFTLSYELWITVVNASISYAMIFRSL